MHLRTLLPCFLAMAIGMGAGCASPSDDEESSGELEQSQDEIREVVPGPVKKSTGAEVWSVDNQWADKSTANAKKSGVAWGEDSGLTWEEKYQKWASSFEKVDGLRFGKTIRIATPYGRTLDGPVLECADVAIWLRMTFSAWYHLPFYLTGFRNGKAIYFGHFGVVDGNGDPVPGFPAFKSRYKDFETTWKAEQRWPSDPTLRTRHVGDDDSAEGVHIGEDTVLAAGDGAGAYFDELFLNKRAGYLMLLLDGNFGSANLADGANMFHIQPEATSPGDALVERWQKNGIGHTLPLMTVVKTPNGKMRVSTASGSMPRRQPVWDDEAQSANAFKSELTGGTGDSFDGVPYAKLGGGIRRWRTPVSDGSRWNNIVPLVFRDVYIEDRNLEAIAARPDTFKVLLAEDTPEAARDAALASIASARTSLLEHPASCSSRTRREEAFDALYDVMGKAFGKSRGEVDRDYRKLEDYVFAELDYNKSKTCCWNSTTPKMAEIVLDFAAKEKAKNDEAKVCKQPTPFRSTVSGRYDTWKAYAASIGRAADWKEWSEDEPCAQRAVTEDAIAERGKADLCSVPVAPVPAPPAEQPEP
jgi:hypothetical protein